MRYLNPLILIVLAAFFSSTLAATNNVVKCRQGKYGRGITGAISKLCASKKLVSVPICQMTTNT